MAKKASRRKMIQEQGTSTAITFLVIARCETFTPFIFFRLYTVTFTHFSPFFF